MEARPTTKLPTLLPADILLLLLPCCCYISSFFKGSLKMYSENEQPNTSSSNEFTGANHHQQFNASNSFVPVQYHHTNQPQQHRYATSFNVSQQGQGQQQSFPFCSTSNSFQHASLSRIVGGTGRTTTATSAFTPTDMLLYTNGTPPLPPSHTHSHTLTHFHSGSTPSTTKSSFGGYGSSKGENSTPFNSSMRTFSGSSALPACFDEQLKLSRKRGRSNEQDLQNRITPQHTTSSSSSLPSSSSSSSSSSTSISPFNTNTNTTSSSAFTTTSRSSDYHDEFVRESVKRLRSCSPTDDVNSTTHQYSVPTGGRQSVHSFSEHTTSFEPHRPEISPMRDSKKRGRTTTETESKKVSIFHRPWEAYPSDREREFRRNGHAQQNGHSGRRHSKSARLQYTT